VLEVQPSCCVPPPDNPFEAYEWGLSTQPYHESKNKANWLSPTMPTYADHQVEQFRSVHLSDCGVTRRLKNAR
jgi:hypothetical protein